jgi:GTP cyclohydrolase II
MDLQVKIRKIKKALNLDQDEIELMTNNLEPERVNRLLEAAVKVATRQADEAMAEYGCY